MAADAVSPREGSFIVQDLAPLHSWTEARLHSLRSAPSKPHDSTVGNVSTVRVALLALLRRSWQAVVQLAANYVVPPAEGVAANATIRASCERIGILAKEIATSCQGELLCSCLWFGVIVLISRSAGHLATLWDLARLTDYQRVQSAAMEHLQSVGREITVLLTEQRQISVVTFRFCVLFDCVHCFESIAGALLCRTLNKRGRGWQDCLTCLLMHLSTVVAKRSSLHSLITSLCLCHARTY